MERLLGGRPLAVAAKLFVLSVVVGAILTGLGLTPRRLLAFFVEAVQSVFGLGFDAVRDIGHIILTGAVIVVPIWLVMRLLDRGR